MCGGVEEMAWFKIAAFPKCYIEDIVSRKMSLFDWIDMSLELEPEGLELYSGFLQSYDETYLKEVRNRIEGYSLKMPMMCYSPDFTIPDIKARKDEVERQKKVICVAAALGGEFCRVLSGQRRPEVSRREGVDWVVECIESCLPEAEKNDVTLVIENHYKDSFWKHPEFAQKKDVFMEIVNRIDSPYFGVQYDPSNAIVAGDDPLELLEELKSRVKTVHASDRFLKEGATLNDLRQADGTIGYSPNLSHGVTGKGLNDYDAILSTLREADFNGWVSIEDGMNGMGEMKESMDFLRMMRDKYF
jgi:sugar phosphate isomerase/epimerase